MKLLLIPFTALLLNGCGAGADTSKAAEGQASTQAVTGVHTCSAACTNGNHVYAHGESGHVCDASCMTTEALPADTAEVAHGCTNACLNGEHMYAHGEKGRDRTVHASRPCCPTDGWMEASVRRLHVISEFFRDRLHTSRDSSVRKAPLL